MRRPEGPQPRHRRWARAAAGVVAAAAVISVLHQAWAGVADVEIAALEPGHQAQQARFAPTLPPPCPSSRFLLLFSGHQVWKAPGQALSSQHSQTLPLVITAFHLLRQRSMSH